MCTAVAERRLRCEPLPRFGARQLDNLPNCPYRALAVNYTLTRIFEVLLSLGQSLRRLLVPCTPIRVLYWAVWGDAVDGIAPGSCSRRVWLGKVVCNGLNPLELTEVDEHRRAGELGRLDNPELSGVTSALLDCADTWQRLCFNPWTSLASPQLVDNALMHY